MTSVIVAFLGFATVLATGGDAGHLMNFITIQSKRFGIDSIACVNALAECSDGSKPGMSTGAQVAIAVVVIAILLAVLKFVKFLIKVIIGHAVALGVLYTFARYVPFVRRYFIQVLSRKAA